MTQMKQASQVVSKQRVTDHGEVYTASREVNAMLDLVKQETERIESRFLEPACGAGNFLAVILRRKLSMVETKYAKSQIEYERNAVLVISSVYGIDILEDNVQDCRNRLFEIFNERYVTIFQNQIKKECLDSVKFILSKNIIWGDALTLKTVGVTQNPITFSEWSPVNGSNIKRRDFTFHGLLAHEEIKSEPLFSDLGDDVFIPDPVREYPVTHFLRLIDAD